MTGFRKRRIAVALGETIGDIRYGLRGLRKNPAFASVAILTLGLAIAANTSIFSVVNAVLLRPLPFDSPERLMMLWTRGPGEEVRGRPDYVTVEAWRRESETFEAMGILDPVTVTMAHADGTERISVARASPDLFPLLGLRALHGRSFSAAEAAARRHIALLSHDFWQRRFGGSEDVLGSTVRLDGRTSEIIGILPPGFRIPGLDGDVWEPHTLFPEWEATGNEGTWFVLGRLRPDVALERARAEMNAIARALDEIRPAADRIGSVEVVPLERYVVGPVRRLALWALTAAAVVVLLIAGANVVSLSLARGLGRAREFAVRATLGASPGRLVRQMLTESVTLAVIAGMVGTLLAVAGIELIRSFGPPDLPRLDQARLDPAVLLWTLGLSLLTGVLIGLAPTWTQARRDQRPSAAEGGRGGSAGVATRRVRRGLVVAELALAIILLTGAGLLVRSWLSLSRVDPGFETERILSVNLTTSAFESDTRRIDFYRAVLQRVRALPGVEDAGMIGDLLTDNGASLAVTVEGRGVEERLSVRIDEVSDDLFATLRTPLIAGRPFSDRDRADAPPVAIINEQMADRLFPGGDPVGRRFKPGGPESAAEWITIVGVVGDMRRQGLGIEPMAQLFVPLAQQPSGSEILLVRASASDPLDLIGVIRDAVRGVDPRVPLYFATALADQLRSDLGARRFHTSLLIAFALVALIMAAIGIYGLIHFSVAARRREFAVRMAVGARAADILVMAMGEGLKLGGIGLALGVGGALIVGRVGSGLLFGVSPTDPVTLAAVSLLLAGVTAAACWFPARRSTKVDPVAALRPD